MTVPVAFFGGAPGGTEFILVFIVVLVLFGAKNIPEIARSIGKTVETLRRTARDVTDEIMHADEAAPSQPSKEKSTETPPGLLPAEYAVPAGSGSEEAEQDGSDDKEDSEAAPDRPS